MMAGTDHTQDQRCPEDPDPEGPDDSTPAHHHPSGASVAGSIVGVTVAGTPPKELKVAGAVGAGTSHIERP